MYKHVNVEFLDWNKDYIASPYPKTQEEREAAAKKYGIDIAEYKPIADDGTGFGDYPDLPAISGDARDPNYPWDMPEWKRNFNEPVSSNLFMTNLIVDLDDVNVVRIIIFLFSTILLTKMLLEFDNNVTLSNKWYKHRE